MNRSLTVTAAIFVCAFALSACTHALSARSVGQALSPRLPERRLALALEDRSSNPEEHRYFDYVHQALAVQANVVPVSQMNRPGDPFLPSRVVRIRPRAQYEGSPWNYFITFPGFLLFTHAWNGFVYRARVDTEVEIVDESGRLVKREKIPAAYDLRYTSFARGAWTSSGWYTPVWGGLNLVIGFFMVPYDPRATEEFQKEAGPGYGQYVAGRILELAATAPPRGDVILPMPAAAAPPMNAPSVLPRESAPHPLLPPAAVVPGTGTTNRESRSPATASTAGAAAVPSSVAVLPTLIEKLRELKRLHEAGEMGDGDYEAVRSRVIKELVPAEASGR